MQKKKGTLFELQEVVHYHDPYRSNFSWNQRLKHRPSYQPT